MPSSRRTDNPRRKTYLNLSGQVEGQLRQAYARKYEAGQINQSNLATKLGINRSAVHHRLMGHTNMTLESLADMVWALDHVIKVEIQEPGNVRGSNSNPYSGYDTNKINLGKSPPPGTTPQKLDTTPKPIDVAA